MQDWIKSKENDMVKMLSRWVKIPSVSVFAPESAQPFGVPCAEMLALALSDAEKLGLRVHNYDNYVGTVELNGEAPALGIAVHLDVVPAEQEGWSHAPYGGEIANGRVYGRGASDNKSAGVSALHALLAYRAFCPGGKNVRIFFGCNEEFGMNDFKYYIDRYEKKAEMPPIIVPDAGNHITYGQYGIISAAFDINAQGQILSIESGGVKSVPGSGRAVVTGMHASDVRLDLSSLDCEIGLEDTTEGLVITSTGLACHPCAPACGKNAAVALLKVLCSLPLTGKQKTVVEALNAFYGDPSLTEEQDRGNLTSVMTELRLSSGRWHIAHNARTRNPAMQALMKKKLDEKIAANGFTLTFDRDLPPHSIDPDCAFIRRLTKVQTAFEGKAPTMSVTHAGNYARMFETAVGYGHYSAFMAHKKDEYIPIDYVVRASQLMALTMEEFGTR